MQDNTKESRRLRRIHRRLERALGLQPYPLVVAPSCQSQSQSHPTDTKGTGTVIPFSELRNCDLEVDLIEKDNPHLIVPPNIERSCSYESKHTFSIYGDGSTRISPLFDTVRLTALLHGERLDKNRAQADYIFSDTYLPTNLNKMKMHRDAKRSLTIANAGGKSVLSEMLSMQYFVNVLDAESILLEQEVKYWAQYKQIDFLCSIKGVRVGVSVTRAMTYPNPNSFSLSHAKELLDKKLYGLIVSRNAVQLEHAFFKSVLHVWCQTPRIAALVRRAYEQLDISSYGLDVKGVVILVLTVCTENYIYTDRRPEEEAAYLQKKRDKLERSRTSP